MTISKKFLIFLCTCLCALSVTNCQKTITGTLPASPVCLRCDQCTDSIVFNQDFGSVHDIYPRQKFPSFDVHGTGVWFVDAWQYRDTLKYLRLATNEVEKSFPLDGKVHHMHITENEVVCSFNDLSIQILSQEDGSILDEISQNALYGNFNPITGEMAFFSNVQGTGINVIYDENLNPRDTLSWGNDTEYNGNLFGYSTWTGEHDLSFISKAPWDWGDESIPSSIYTFNTISNNFTADSLPQYDLGTLSFPAVFSTDNIGRKTIHVRKGQNIASYTQGDSEFTPLISFCESVSIPRFDVYGSRLILAVYINRRIDYLNMESRSELVLFNKISKEYTTLLP